MKHIYKIVVPVLLLVAGVLVVAWYLQNNDIAVLNPQGVIASEQRDLLVTVTLLMLIIVIPVFLLTFWIAWRYRETNTKATYRPDWDGNSRLEAAWWGIPFAIIAVLSVMIWTSSHALDPYRPIESDKEPLKVQVVALQWKWLFLYPEENIATVNVVHFPKDRPVILYNTSDAPMSSLWIPQLGGQIYAMNGMVTRLHVMASQAGSYHGASANINGKGFAGMYFKAQVSEQADFDSWVESVKRSSEHLDQTAYDELAKPSENNKPAQYASFPQGLHDTIVMKYMAPHGGDSTHLEGTH